MKTIGYVHPVYLQTPTLGIEVSPMRLAVSQEELVLRTDADAAIAKALEQAALIAEAEGKQRIADNIRALKGKPCKS